MSNQSGSGSIVLKVVGFAILAFVAIFLFSTVVSAVVGFVKLLLAIGLIILVASAVVWALRKL